MFTPLQSQKQDQVCATPSVVFPTLHVQQKTTERSLGRVSSCTFGDTVSTAATCGFPVSSGNIKWLHEIYIPWQSTKFLALLLPNKVQYIIFSSKYKLFFSKVDSQAFSCICMYIYIYKIIIYIYVCVYNIYVLYICMCVWVY